MNRFIRYSCLVLALVAISAAVCEAGHHHKKDKDEWKQVASFTAVGGGKEVALTSPISEVRFKCTAGMVIINTIVIRNGGQGTQVTIGVEMNAGQEHVRQVGDKVPTTGIRIGDDGGGQYEVYVKD